MRPNSIHAPLAPAKGRPRPSASALAAAVVLLLIAQPARAQDAAPAPTTAPAQTGPRLVAPETAAPPTPANSAPASTAEPSNPVTDASTPDDAAATEGTAAGPDTDTAPSAAIPQPLGGDVAGSPQPGEAPSDDAVGEATLPHDLSPWGMFMAADYVVKSVMVGLAFASLVTWTIWLAKALELWAARTKASRALRCLERASSLPEAVTPKTGLRWPKRGPVAALASAAAIEIERSDGLDAEGVKERAAVALQRIEARAGRTMARGTGLLATIGSTAPFVGLFGTVWGIMNAFIGISRSNTTNLAVVAPGIAEALLATAIGLVAAIPAVIIYNVFARSIAGYRAVLGDASAEILRHLSRDLDRRAERAAPPARALQAAE